MRLTVIGGGYVGLVTVVCFCEFGFEVCVVEENSEKLKKLEAGESMVYEPDVDRMLKRFLEYGRITFSGDIATAISDSEAVLVAVSTTIENSDSDLTRLSAVINKVSSALSQNKYTGLFIRASVPVGTCNTLLENIQLMRPDLIPGEHYDVIANPCFIREGCAVQDFMAPSNEIIGMKNFSEKAKSLVEKLYAPLSNVGVPFIYTNLETAELIITANVAFAAVKMVYTNEISEICKKVNADVKSIMQSLSAEKKIGSSAFMPSPGVGGSTFPKAMRLLKNKAASLGMTLPILESAVKSNANRIVKIKEQILTCITNTEPNTLKKVTILGLTYKPMTSDIKESPSIIIIDALLKHGVAVEVYDPVYTPDSNYISLIPKEIRNNGNFHLSNSPYEAAMQSDLLVIMTNWSEFAELKYEKIWELMKKNTDNRTQFLDYRYLISDKVNENEAT